jgi:FHS family Na+ dependent glucose MFS transporter 1
MKLATLRATSGDGKLARTLSYYAAFTALGLTTSALGPTLPNLAANTNSQISEVSILFSASSLGYIMGASLGGRLFDRLAGHAVMAVAVLAMVLASLVIPLAPLLWLLFIIMFTMGMGQSVVDVGANTLLVWTHRAGVGPYMNALHFFFGAGAFLSPIIIAQVMLLTGGITWAYWIFGLLTLPAALWLLWLPSPAIPNHAEDEDSKPINYPLAGLVVLFLLLYVGAEVSYGGWIFTYTTALNLADETTAAYLTSAFWGALTLGRLFSIPLAMRFRPRTILNGALLGCLASAVALISAGHSLAVVWAATLGMGLFMAPVFPVTISLAERRMAITGQTTGWFFIGGSVGAMVTPWIIGQFFDTIGPAAVMIVIGFILVLQVVAYGALLFQANRIQKL